MRSSDTPRTRQPFSPCLQPAFCSLFLVSLEPFSTKHAMPSRAVTPPLVCTLPSIRDPTVVCGKDTRDSLAAGGPRTVSGHSLPNHSALTGRSSLRQAMLDHLRSHKRPTRGKIDCQYCLYAGLRSVSSRQLFQELGPVLNPFLLQTMEATHKQSHLVRKKLLCDRCRNASYDHSCVRGSFALIFPAYDLDGLDTPSISSIGIELIPTKKIIVQ